MCFNPGPEGRVLSPNRYTLDAKFCFWKNNKRSIIRAAARRPRGVGSRGGRLRTAELVGSRYVARFLGLASLRSDAVGRLWASSSSEAAGLEAVASQAVCVSLANRRSPQSSLPTWRLSPASRSSGRLAAAHRNSRRPRNPRGSGSLGCSRLSRRPPIAPGSPRPTAQFQTIVLPMFGARHRVLASSASRSLRFAHRRRHVRQQDPSRVFPATRMRWRRALRDCGDATEIAARLANMH